VIEESAFKSLIGQQVVLDLASPFVVLGTLRGVEGRYYVVEQADVHDLRDTTTTRENYVLHSRRHGINPNRQRVLVRVDDVIGVSLLSDVLE
jgi:hypothetical protein